MGQQPQIKTVPIVFKGLNTRVDPKTSPLEVAATLENLRFEKLGELRKRNGETSAVPDIDENEVQRIIKAGGALVALGARPSYAGATEGSQAWFSNKLSNYKETKQAVIASHGSYASAQSYYTSIRVRRVMLLNTATAFTRASGAYNPDGTIIVGGEQTGQSTMARVLGKDDLELLEDDNDVNIVNWQPVPIAGGQAVYVWAHNRGTTQICYKTLNNGNFGSVTDIAAHSSTHKFFDVIWVAAESSFYIAHNNGTPKLTITKFQPGVGATTVASSIDCDVACAWMHGVDNKGAPLLWLATADAGNGILYHNVHPSTLAVSAGATIDAAATSGVRNLGGFLINSSGHAHIFWSLDGSSTHQDLVKRSVYTGSASNGEWKYSASLYSRPFLWNERYYAVAVFDGTNQRTYFLLGMGHEDGGSDSVDITGRFLYGEATGQRAAVGNLAEVHGDGAGRFITGVSFTDGLRNGAAVVDIRFEDQAMPAPASVDGYALTPGAATRRVAETATAECGFPLAPHPPTLVANSTGLTGTYGVRTVWRTVDRDGKVTYSPPSEPVLITLSNEGIQITQEYPKLVGKNGSVTETIELLVYRTEAGGSLYWLETDISTVVDPTSGTTHSVTLTSSTKSDANLIADGSLLYTTGGILDDFAPESNIALEGFKDRVFGISAEQRNRVFFSKKVTQGLSIGFHPDLGFLLPDAGGDAVTLKAMDDKLVIWKERATMVLTGDGPDNRGQGEYATPQIVDQVLGCANARAIAMTPLGIMLLTSRGFYLLSRGLSYQYIGGPVHDYLGLTFRDAVVRTDVAEVHWFTTEGRTLVYNWELDSWTTFTEQPAIGAVEYNGEIHWLDASDRVHISDSGFDQYDSGTYQCVLETGWISLAGLSGYQRIHELQLVGEYLSAHDVKVDFAYDFATTYEETGLALSSAGAPWHYKVRPGRQECSAIRIKIYDTAHTGEGFRLSGITLAYQVESGAHRLPAAKALVTPP